MAVWGEEHQAPHALRRYIDAHTSRTHPDTNTNKHTNTHEHTNTHIHTHTHTHTGKGQGG